MTEIIPAPHTTDLTLATDTGSQAILRAVEQMAGAHQLAQALASTAFVPSHFRGKPDDVAAAIMYGAAIGLDPMASLRAIYVVSGTPGMYARQMVAIVQAAGHSMWTEESTDESVTVAGQRRGTEHVERVTWTYARAQKAGYTSNKKYDTDPQAMLWARAASDVARRMAPDALAGLDTSVEELQYIDHVDTPARPKRESAAALLTQVAPAVEQEARERADAEANTREPADHELVPAVEVTMRVATQAQVTAINAALTSRDVTARADKLAWLSQATNRRITSSKDLTFDEASALLDHFAEEATDVTPEPDGSELAAES